MAGAHKDAHKQRTPEVEDSPVDQEAELIQKGWIEWSLSPSTFPLLSPPVRYFPSPGIRFAWMLGVVIEGPGIMKQEFQAPVLT
jgi:hypothetical protein